MCSEIKSTLLSFIPSLRAFAFCLTQDRSQADEFLHASLIKMWSELGNLQGAGLKGVAFNTVRRQFLSQVIVDSILSSDPGPRRFRRRVMSSRQASHAYRGLSGRPCPWPRYGGSISLRRPKSASVTRRRSIGASAWPAAI